MKIECIELAENTKPYQEGYYFAVIQKTPYLQGTTMDFFKSLKKAKLFIKKILNDSSTRNWVSEIERKRLEKFASSIRVSCPKCQNVFDTNQNKKYISCKCSTKFKNNNQGD